MSELSLIHSAAYGIQAYASLSTKSGEQPLPSTSPAPPTADATSEQAAVQVSLSQEGRALSAGQKRQEDPEENRTDTKTDGQDKAPKSTVQPFNEAELRQIQELKSRDTEVRAHEQAHLNAAGSYAAGGPSYSYQTGPDGKRYAVGGSVPIDMSSESTPEATVIKMETVKRAALAPADPSAADRQIAAEAGMKEMQARQEIQSRQTASLASSMPAGQKNKTAESQDPTRQEDLNTVSPTKQPSPSTQQMMLAAYQAMATVS